MMVRMSPETRALLRATLTEALSDVLPATPDPVQIESCVLSLEPIIASIHENARRLGNLQGEVAALQEVMLERRDEEDPLAANMLAEASRLLAEVSD